MPRPIPMPIIPDDAGVGFGIGLAVEMDVGAGRDAGAIDQQIRPLSWREQSEQVAAMHDAIIAISAPPR